jgi:hypothetical protein
MRGLDGAPEELLPNDDPDDWSRKAGELLGRRSRRWVEDKGRKPSVYMTPE